MTSRAADPLVASSFEANANEINDLARSDLPTVLRRLQRRSAQETSRLAWLFERQGGENRLLRALSSRMSGLSTRASGYRQDRERVELLARRLDLRIQRFLDWAAYAGSPQEYQHELREARAIVGRLLESDPTRDLSPDAFHALTRILDLVELTRTDVERRLLDQDPTVALRFVLAHFPSGSLDTINELLNSNEQQRAAVMEGGAPSASELDRLRLVAQLVYDLRHSYTAGGLQRWFYKSFREFDGKRPLDLMNGDQAARDRLRSYAKRLRSQTET